MKAIIPTGGRGTRMRPLTFSANKHFIPVANKPLIFYPIETVAKAGIKEIALTYNPGGLEEAQSILGDGSRWGLKFTYVLQEKPTGLANIFQVCEEYLAGESFLMHNGDNMFVDGIEDLVSHFQNNKPNAIVTYVQHEDNRRLGVPYFDENGKFIKYVEKPENPPNNFGIPGLYFFDSNVFKCFREDPIQPSLRGELEISAPYNWLIDHGYKVEALEYKGVWMDPGKFDDWLEANQYILEHKLEEKKESELESTQVNGKVSVGKNCQVRNSTLNGPLIIGENVEIDGATINPHAAVADNCVIKNSTVGNCVILSGTKVIDVKRPIEESLIGKDTEVLGNGESIKLFIGEMCKVEI